MHKRTLLLVVSLLAFVDVSLAAGAGDVGFSFTGKTNTGTNFEKVPAPAPKPKQKPAPKPAPKPEPQPAPAEPKPAPAEPKPEPKPAPAEPKPDPQPAPAEPKPEPEPAPKPAPQPAIIAKPKPEPQIVASVPKLESQPAPAPVPKPAPAPAPVTEPRSADKSGAGSLLPDSIFDIISAINPTNGKKEDKNKDEVVPAPQPAPAPRPPVEAPALEPAVPPPVPQPSVPILFDHSSDSLQALPSTPDKKDEKADILIRQDIPSAAPSNNSTGEVITSKAPDALPSDLNRPTEVKNNVTQPAYPAAAASTDFLKNAVTQSEGYDRRKLEELPGDTPLAYVQMDQVCDATCKEKFQFKVAESLNKKASLMPSDVHVLNIVSLPSGKSAIQFTVKAPAGSRVSSKELVDEVLFKQLQDNSSPLASADLKLDRTSFSIDTVPIASKPGQSLSGGEIAGVVIGILVVCSVVAGAVVFTLRKKQADRAPSSASPVQFDAVNSLRGNVTRSGTMSLSPLSRFSYNARPLTVMTDSAKTLSFVSEIEEGAHSNRSSAYAQTLNVTTASPTRRQTMTRATVPENEGQNMFSDIYDRIGKSISGFFPANAERSDKVNANDEYDVHSLSGLENGRDTILSIPEWHI